MLQTVFSPRNNGDLFADMRRMQSAMNQLFEGTRTAGQSATFPPVNFWASQDSIVMTTELPGLTEQDIELTVKDTMLQLRGTYPEPENSDDITWHRHERVDGTFLRTVELPFIRFFDSGQNVFALHSAAIIRQIQLPHMG